ncbi:MAG TPA: slipin family protein [Pyrinomonadaceae bacterium]|nr:slipin family protein [Pyrinomonadaceae bacterium]
MPFKSTKIMRKDDIIIKDTHRGLLYEDGVLVKTLEAGRYEPPRLKWYERLIPKPWRRRLPKIELALVDIRERDLTIKGQEILTADKVAIRVSIIVQFKVRNPQAALHEVESYSDRIYGDVQLAARRSLASMTLEEILTNRNKLSEDILLDVKESATTYGVAILRADVKDLIFPGNLQEIMNRVLAAERMSQVQLVEARTKAQTQRLEAQSRLETQRLEAEANAAAQKLRAESEAESQRIQTEADILSLRERAQAAEAYSSHPALLRLRELDTLRELARTANARIYIGFDKHMQSSTANGDQEK